LDEPDHVWLPRLLAALAELGLPTPRAPSAAPRASPAPTQPARLPEPLTSFVGRETELATLRARLLAPDVRLVTLLGPGGVGKTRLALAVARAVAPAFPDGVVFVPLAPARDPSLVLPTIAQVLGLREGPQQPAAEVLRTYLAAKTCLLVLDNLEHLLDAAPTLSALLQECPRLKLLATSRAALRVYGEHEYVVSPLALGMAPGALAPEVLLQSDAVRLFVERARAVRPDFALDAGNGAAVAALCRRLDGLPLAIELAAARVRLFSPQALLARLDRALPLLTGGARDLPERQQTLRGAIAWSYELLPQPEQALFRRLAVFAGGFSLDAASAIWQTSEPPAPPTAVLDVLDGLDSLLSKSLLSRYQFMPEPDDDAPRFAMLETIREYGLERLEAHGETDGVRRLHARFFLALAEEAEPELTGSHQQEWLERLERDHDNLRVALDWALATDEVELALRLAGSLWPFWNLRGYLDEARERMGQVLAHGGDASRRAKALTGAGTLAWSQGEYGQAAGFHREALGLYRALGDERGTAVALNNLGVQALTESDYDRATALYEESLALYRQWGDERGTADILNNLGVVAQYQGDYARAMRLYEESLVLRRKLGDQQRIANGLFNLGEIAYYRQEYERAAALYQESLRVRRELGVWWGVPLCLAALASTSARLGAWERAARLGGAAEALFATTGTRPDPSDGERFDQTRATVLAKLGQTADDGAWAVGRQLPVEEAIAEALAGPGPSGQSAQGKGGTATETVDPVPS
ncbi:MAG TPA: tetratricopeptide repeat protein, partial [Thermomicrobiaceae bacterium]|nr:tetratricopeptide repeat protein [Thermomicrobiaceae bacterium]